MKSIGVLALQGAVSEHLDAVVSAGVNAVEVKTADQLSALDGLIIPGGESTAIRKLMQHYDLIEPIKAFAEAGKGIFGTCAGLVLLASSVESGDECLGLIDCEVRRNGFGRQKESFEIDLAVPVLGEPAFPAVFIRAPWIKSIGKQLKVLARHDDKIVAAQQDNILVTAFHPELSDDNRLIRYFISSCLK